MLDKHNERRAKHRAPPLQWDDDLAESAQIWADGCRGLTHSGSGENLGIGYEEWSDVLWAWYNEVNERGSTSMRA